MPQKTYSNSRVIDYALCDYRGELRLSGLLAAAQQISMEHCDSVGVGGGYFWDRGMAFLLAKLSLDIFRAPKGGEVIDLFTQPNLPTRAQYRRRTDFSAGGELLARMDARWVLADLSSRRLLRRLPQGVQLPFLDAEELEDFRPAPLDGLTQREAVTVRYSMVDINGHMNNTAYGDLVVNLLEHRLLAGERLRHVDIFYHREAMPGDQIILSLGEEGKRFYVRGTVQGAVCFEAGGLLEMEEHS